MGGISVVLLVRRPPLPSLLPVLLHSGYSSFNYFFILQLLLHSGNNGCIFTFSTRYRCTALRKCYYHKISSCINGTPIHSFQSDRFRVQLIINSSRDSSNHFAACEHVILLIHKYPYWKITIASGDVSTLTHHQRALLFRYYQLSKSTENMCISLIQIIYWL